MVNGDTVLLFDIIVYSLEEVFGGIQNFSKALRIGFTSFNFCSL